VRKTGNRLIAIASAIIARSHNAITGQTRENLRGA
jgi:hypothetical protein